MKLGCRGDSSITSGSSSTSWPAFVVAVSKSGSSSSGGTSTTVFRGPGPDGVFPFGGGGAGADGRFGTTGFTRGGSGAGGGGFLNENFGAALGGSGTFPSST